MRSTSMILLVLAGLLASTMATAAPEPAAFQAEKTKRLAGIQEKLQIVQKHLACVEASQDHAALKACHDTARKEHDALTAKLMEGAKHPE